MWFDRSDLRQAASTLRLGANVVSPRQTLLLFSHMRSYSSLLCHILNSNPEIDGYGELGISYRTPLDLVNMRYQISVTTGSRLSGRYALDKLLHPGASISDTLLRSPSTTVMVGFRQPEESVRSIMAMGLAKKKPDWKADPERATNHYLRRLNYCIDLVDKRPDVLVFPTDALVNDTATFLSGLTEWLELDEPLTPHYELGEMTGRPRFGDTSEQIKTGTIATERPVHEVEIPAELIDTMWAAYDRTLDVLFARADHVLCPDARVARDEASPPAATA